MNRSAQFAAIGRIYETVISSQDFRPLLEIIMTWTGASEAHFWQYDAQKDVSYGISAKKLSRKKFSYESLFTDGPARARAEGCQHADDIVNIDDDHRSVKIACLSAGDQKSIYLETITPPAKGRSADIQASAFADLVNILRHAISLDIEPVSAQFGRLATQVLERLAIGVAVYDPTVGTVTGANTRAKELLQRQGIHLADRAKFGATHTPLAKGLAGYAAQIASAAQSPVLLDWQDGNTNIPLLGFALEQEGGAMDAPVAFMFLPDGNSETVQAYVGRKYGLTQREQAVARALLCGDKLPDIAAALDLGHETVRSHAKAIFAKCDVHGHAEFVAKFLTGVDALDWSAMRNPTQPKALETV